MTKFSWSKIVESFEASFKTTFDSDKKAHFDNLPDGLKIVDGAKGFWSHLLLFDAIVYVLENDSFKSTSRRAFHQHKVLCKCVLQQLQNIDSQSYSELLEEKQFAAVKNGNYVALSIKTSLQLAKKYSHLLTIEDLEAPWNTLDNLRASVLDMGPPSKAKSKFSQIANHLLSCHHFTNHESMSSLIRSVIHRVLFVVNNYMMVFTSPRVSRKNKGKDREVRYRRKMMTSRTESQDGYDDDQQQQQSMIINSSESFDDDVDALSVASSSSPSPHQVVCEDLLEWSDSQFDAFFNDEQHEGEQQQQSSEGVMSLEDEVKQEEAQLLLLSINSEDQGHQAAAAAQQSLGGIVHLHAQHHQSLSTMHQHYKRARTDNDVSTLHFSTQSAAFSFATASSSRDEYTSNESSNTSSGKTQFSTDNSHCLFPSHSSPETKTWNDSEERSLLGPAPSLRSEIQTVFVDPKATEYILCDGVYCAVVPVNDPQMQAALMKAANKTQF